MLKQASLFAFLVLVLLGFGVRQASADIYRYVNDEGIICFADNLESVPAQYRAIAVNTTAEEEKNQVLRSQTGPQANIAPSLAAPREEPAATMTFTARLLMTVGVVFVWFGILMTIKKTGVFKGREKFLPTTQIVLGCIFLVYLVMVHGKDAVGLFTMAGNKIEAVREKQAQRGRKAGQAIKALNAIMEEAGKQPLAPDQGEEKNN
jgi:hypothetical protein